MPPRTASLFLPRTVRGAAVTGRGKNSDAVRGGILERVAQVLERLKGAERVFGRTEALRDDVGEMIRHHVVLGLHQLREALHTEGLGVVRVNEQDVRAWRDGVGGLDVERDLERPG